MSCLFVLLADFELLVLVNSIKMINKATSVRLKHLRKRSHLAILVAFVC